MVKNKPEKNKQKNRDSSNYVNLVVYNDDVNTFDHVISTLVDVCKHEPEQAEQCTLIIHHKGKCVVRSGDKKIMIDMCQKIHERNITAKVE